MEPIKEPKEEPIQVPPQEVLALVAEGFLEREASPEDNAPDELACVESLTNILRFVYSDFPQEISTIILKKRLDNSPHFKPTLALDRGNIILSVTGTGNGTIVGHCGILRGNSRIMSNTSKNGLWQDNYSVNAWVNRFRIRGGMKIYVYEPV